MKSFENLTINDYVAIIRRRIWYLIVSVVVISAATLVYVRRLPSIYKSETTILVSRRFLPEDVMRSVVSETNNERIDFVKQQLESRTFLERIVREFQLGGPGSDGIEAAVNGVRASKEVTQLSGNVLRLGYFATDPNLAQAVTRRLAESVIQLNDSFRKEKVVVVDQYLDDQQREAQTKFFETEDKLRKFYNQHYPGVPQDQATVMNNLRDLQTKLSVTENALNAATSVKKALERRLEEHQLVRTVLKSPAPPTPRPTATQQAAAPSLLEQRLVAKQAELAIANSRYTRLYPEVVRLTREVEELEAQVKQLRATQPAQAPVTNAADPVGPLPILEADLDLLPAEIQLEIEKTTAEIARLGNEKKDIQTNIALHQARLNPPAELTDLSRQYDDSRQRLNILSDKKLSSEMSGRVDTSENNEIFKVVDGAFLPRFPVKPDRTLLTGAGCLASIFLGLLVVFAREFLDPSLSDADDAAAELKLSALASIPFVKGQKDPKKDLKKVRFLEAVPTEGDPFDLKRADSAVKTVILEPRTPVGEQFRLIRSKLSTLQKQRNVKSIMIASAIPSDGKTFVACCLAGILAQEPGKRVLLIDADLRRSSARRLLGINEQHCTFGLSEILRGTGQHQLFEAGDIPLEPILLKCASKNLFFLPVGTVGGNAAELLSSPELERLIRQAERMFDWVVIDTPPTLAFADANLMTPLCGTTLVVVRAGKTPKALVKDVIQAVGADRICGFVMNRVKNVKTNKYFDGYYDDVGVAAFPKK